MRQKGLLALSPRHKCKLLFGFPNDESYPVMIKGFKVKDIGRLTTYILPIKIGPIIPRMRWLDPFFRLFLGL